MEHTTEYLTPAQKAEQLLGKCGEVCQHMDIYEREFCAMIVVDEVIDNILPFDPQKNYWDEVKKQINILTNKNK